MDTSGLLSRPKSCYVGRRTHYQILPFRFMRLDSARCLLVNEVGEYLLLPSETFDEFVGHRLAHDRDVYLALKARHFLLDSEGQAGITLLATKYRTKKSFLQGFTKLHIFVVTLRCDHSCQYCQVSRVSLDRTNYDMSPETAEKSVDLMFRSPADPLKVEFQGGEPLARFDLLKFIMERVTTLNALHRRRVEFVVATNLALLTDEMLDFFRAYNVHISTSLDGPEHVHSTNRPRLGNDSWQVTMRNIRRVREALGHDRVSALMTTTKLSLKYPGEIVDEYINQGFDAIFLRPLSPYGFAVKTKARLGYTIDEWLDFYRRALRHILQRNREGRLLVETYAQIVLTKMLTPFATGFVDLQSPAGVGIGGVVYNYDGGVYVSDEGRMLAEMGCQEFRLGSVHEDRYEEIFGGERLRALVAASCNESLPGCADCAFQTYCGSDPVRNYATTGDVYGHRPTTDFCQKNMGVIRLLLETYENGDEATREVMWSWVRNVPRLHLPAHTSSDGLHP